MIRFDRFGIEQVLDDDARIETTLKLIELGYAEMLIMSHDAGVFSINTPPSWSAEHAPNWRYTNIPTCILAPPP